MKKIIFIVFISIAFSGSAQNNQNSIREKLNLSQLGLSQKASNGEIDKKLLKTYRDKKNIYLDVNEKDITSLKNQYPKEVSKIIEVADQVSRNYFLFRYEWDMEKTSIPYQFKKNINWTIVPFGDMEWTWMLNRHRYWIDLGKAYYFTKNEAYARTWASQAADWIKKNPIDDKTVSAYSWRRIEAGIRCENWIKSFEYFKNSPSVTPQFLSIFLNSLSEHAEYLNRTFSVFSKTSNWGVLELNGQFTASVFLSEFKNADNWRETAIQRLDTCVQLQILPDGTQWEQSPMYHNEVLHCCLNVNLIAQKQNIKLPQTFIEKTKAMAMADVKWQKPNYHQPLFGDSDDSDLRTMLTLSACLFNDSVLKSRAFTEIDFENKFLLSINQQKTYTDIKSQLPDFKSTYLQSSGYMIFRNCWDESANYATLNLKKIGSGHAHDDLLSFTLFANGRDYLVDGGRYTYVESELRKKLKSSPAHNSLAVDDQPNSIYEESWGNSYNARSQGIYTKMTSIYDYAEAENNAYKRLADPVMLKRRMLYLKPGLWIMFDSFSANGTHKYSQYFNFSDKQIAVKKNSVSTTYEKDNLLIKAVKDVMISEKSSQWSPEYNLLKDNQQVELSRVSKGFDSFITALYFPDTSNITCNKIPVYNRNNVQLTDEFVEAIEITYNNKEFIVMLTHNSQPNLTPFYIIKNTLVSGEFVLLEKKADEYITHLIKE